MGFVGLCLLVGLSGGTIAAGALHSWFPRLAKPPMTPPEWVYVPIWGMLYVMMGVSGWMVWQRNGASRPLQLWGWQLAANALWVPAFFGLHSVALGMVDLMLMLILVGVTIHTFRRVRRLAAWLLVPYFAWCLFAAYLNAGFLVLNPA